jgi:hypothetical protein
LLGLVSGCTTVESQSFRVQQGGNVESAQIATDADFSKYDTLMAEEMGIFFPQNVTVPAEDLRRIRQIFRSAFIAELEGYRIVQEPGPSTMEVQASLIDLRQSAGGGVPQLRREIQDVAAPGSLVFLMEMRDSESDRILARAADSASTPAIATTAGVETDWSSVEAAAQRWAALFRQFLDQNLGR